MSSIVNKPIPQGNYVPAVRNADIIYTSGMTPRKAGKLVFSGKMKAADVITSHKDAVELAVLNALNAAKSCLSENESIEQILQLSVFLNTENNFTQHSKIADFASNFLVDHLGKKCIGSRAAIGVASLPSDAPVEIMLTAKVVAK